jgi:hypothetical protein
MKRPRCLLGTETVKAGSHRAAATSEVRQFYSIAWRCSLTTTLRNLLRMARRPRRQAQAASATTGLSAWNRPVL